MTTFPLVYVRCSRGRRVAHFSHSEGLTSDFYWCQVWIDKAHRWSRSVRVRISRFLGPIDRRDPVAKRAIRAAMPGHPPCHHKDHGGTVAW